MAESLQIDSAKGVLELTSDLFQPKSFDARYESVRYHTYVPVAAISTNSNNVEFSLPAMTSKSAYLTTNIVLVMDVKLTKKDGSTAVTKTNFIAPVANILHSIWEKVSVQIGDRDLNQSPDAYNIRAYLQTIMNNTVEGQSEKCFSRGLMRDTVNHYDVYGPLNLGFTRRRMCFFHVNQATPGDSAYVTRPFTFVGIVYHDLCQNDRPILWGVPLKFTFVKAPEAFYMGVNDTQLNEDFLLTITRLELRVPIAVLSDKLIQHIERTLTDKTPCLYYYRRFHVSRKPIATGLERYEDNNIFGTAELPARVYIVFSTQGRIFGKLELNPFLFA